MEDTSSKEGIRKLLLSIGCNDYDWSLLSLNCSLGLMNIELHLIKLPEKVIRELQVSLVNLINKKNNLLLRLKCLTELAELNVSGNIINALFTELSIIKSLDCIIHIETILSLSSGFDIPDDKLLAKRLSYCLS